MTLPVEYNVPLAPRTTLGLGGAARCFVTAHDDAAVIDALRFAEQERLQVAILGGGSNLVVSDAGFDGLVIAMAQRGVELSQRGAVGRVRARAGEPWDALVALAVERDLAGLECLSGIPGLVGATPVQNVGAYGQEVSETLESVRVLDRQSLQVLELDAGACGFGYRDSGFKRNPDRFVVLEASFALRAGGEPSLRYAELRSAFGSRASVTLAEVRQTVLELRRKKSMLLDPSDENRRSAGSFFLNPVVDESVAQAIAARCVSDGVIASEEQMPRYPAEGGRAKLAAAWLIERAGFRKGERRGAVGISSRHALALVHHGGGSSAQLLALAGEIKDGVRARFGVELTLEPQLLGFTTR